jgi:L-lactate dehydrogenase (FMN-dependent) and related alpha-hydroxy acid dehydrogenases
LTVHSDPARPRTLDVTLSLLNRAKSNGFTALVVTLDTMSIGWRPHDLETAYLPFAHGIGISVGRSDPVFMSRYGRQPIFDSQHEFPYDPVARDKLYLSGDEKTKDDVFLGTEWLKECNSGTYRSWEDLKILRDNWDGPLVLKGIQSVLVCVLCVLLVHNNISDIVVEHRTQKRR